MESMRRRAESLSRAVTESDQNAIERQVQILFRLWEEVLRKVKSRMRTLIELLEAIEKFGEVCKALDRWMNLTEKAVMRDMRLSGSPERQRDRIREVSEKVDYTIL